MPACAFAIKAAEDFHHPVDRLAGLSAVERIVALFWHLDSGSPPEPPRGFSSDAVVLAHVNHGRWCAPCPWCTSSQNASREDHRFFCVECGNAAVGGRWVRVVWPPDWEEIEQVLGARPDVKTRTALPGETAGRLRAENREHGIH